MREIRASDAKTHLPSILNDVERGQTIVITRHGKAIARLVPEPDQRQAKVQCAMLEVEAFRKTMPNLSVEELTSARHEGHRF